MQPGFRHLGRSRSARWRPGQHGAARERGVAGVGVGTVAAGRGRARAPRECDRQPVLAGVTSRPWVNWPISVQGATCGASRARTVTAAAASAVNASPKRVDSAARVARTSRSTRAIHPTPCSRNHSTWWSSRTARTQRRTVEAGWRSAGTRSRGRWPATPCRSPRWCRLGAAAPPRAAAHGCHHRTRIGPVGAAASASPTPSHGHHGPARVPTGAARRRIPGRPARLRPGPPRPAPGPRSRSPRCRFGTAHQRGLSRASAAEANWCWPDPIARFVHCGDSRRVTRRHRDDLQTRQEPGETAESAQWRRRRVPRARTGRRHRRRRETEPPSASSVAANSYGTCPGWIPRESVRK
jgi:hypothetical protein